MLLRSLLLITGVLFFFNSPAQHRQVIDKEFLRSVHMVYPDFFISEDTAVMRINLNKIYSDNRYDATKAMEKNLLNDSSLKRQLDIAVQLMTDRFLAEIYKQKSTDFIEVSEEEAMKVYKNNKNYFLKEGTVSYIVASLSDTTSQVIKEVKQKLSQLKNTIGKVEFTKSENGKYALTKEENMPISASQPLFPLFENAKNGDIKGPQIVYDRTFYILITNIVPSVLPSFEDVKEQCIQMVRDEKMSQEQYLKAKESEKHFPFRLDYLK